MKLVGTHLPHLHCEIQAPGINSTGGIDHSAMKFNVAAFYRDGMTIARQRQRGANTNTDNTASQFVFIRIPAPFSSTAAVPGADPSWA